MIDFVPCLKFLGIKIPKGTAILMQPHVVNRDPDYWSCPNQFKPERFLDQTNSLAYMSFGSGPRNCIGMKFSFIQIIVCCAKIFKTFEVSCDPDFELQYFNGSAIAIPKEVLVQLKIREFNV